MTLYRQLERKLKGNSSKIQNHSIFMKLHQNLLNLDLLKELPAFTITWIRINLKRIMFI